MASMVMKAPETPVEGIPVRPVTWKVTDPLAGIFAFVAPVPVRVSSKAVKAMGTKWPAVAVSARASPLPDMGGAMNPNVAETKATTTMMIERPFLGVYPRAAPLADNRVLIDDFLLRSVPRPYE
ncbi:hypothetical protein [Nonomuraea sp. NPDC049158]|uniref:hypothetical protein n=1 Tax=Nonomuraea sp. NPDC049158 TaxID=3155649 RepID=UPI0033EC9DA0